LVIRIPIAKPNLDSQELNNIIDAFNSGWISSKGSYIEKFESDFADYVGMKFGISTSNGTTALHLALEALGIGKNDKVIIPSLTFIAVANAVRYVGATPVFVDSDPNYWCIDPAQIESKIDKQTKAIIVVHLYGHPCDMGVICQIAKDNGLLIIEDCAEAHGAEYKGKRVGSFGVISCFSFYGNKIITTGEGGMCLTNDIALVNKMKILRDHGMNPEKRYWHDVVGYNYRMTNLQAAIGVAQLQKIDLIINKKRQIASMYKKLLENENSITLSPEMPWAKNVYWLYSILTESKSRNKIIKKFAEVGIETRPFFYTIPMLPPYNFPAVKTPVADELSTKGVNLPSGFHIMYSDVEKIVGCLKQNL